MKAIEGFAFCAAILIVLVCGASAHIKTEKENVFRENEGKPLRSSLFPFDLSSLSLPSILRKPFQGLSKLHIVPPVRITKTEFVEVTRRQTVHPMCYTTYDPVVPCLSHQQDYYHEGWKEGKDWEGHGSAGVEGNIRPTAAQLIQKTAVPDMLRETVPKYLEFGDAMERSDSPAVSVHFPRYQSTETITKTILINKVEKFTDHKVTATLLAINCLPADQNIPVCHSKHNHPIRESPDGFFEDRHDSPDASETLKVQGEEGGKPDDFSKEN